MLPLSWQPMPSDSSRQMLTIPRGLNCSRAGMEWGSYGVSTLIPQLSLDMILADLDGGELPLDDPACQPIVGNLLDLLCYPRPHHLSLWVRI